jgi:hypothetical protein
MSGREIGAKRQARHLVRKRRLATGFHALLKTREPTSVIASKELAGIAG